MCQEFDTTARSQFREWRALMIRPIPTRKIQPTVDICNRYRKLHSTGRCWTGKFLPWWQVNKTSSRTTTKLQDDDQSSSQYQERICLCHKSRLGWRFQRTPRTGEKHLLTDNQTGSKHMLHFVWRMAGQEGSREYTQWGWRFPCVFGICGTDQLHLWWLPPSCQTKTTGECLWKTNHLPWKQV